MKGNRLLYLSLAALVLAGWLALGRKQAPEFRQMSGAAWGTTYHITYSATDDLSDRVLEQIQQIDSELSPFNPSSTLSKINNGEDVAASEMLRQVFALSQCVCSISGGAFDPTLAPLINLWGFGYKHGGPDAPTQADIDSAMQSVGIMQCGISPSGRIAKKSPQTEFNFSAVAKGYGVDRIAQALRQAGCTDYMVEVGGEIALSGHNPHGENWKIQIDAPVFAGPDNAAHEPLGAIRLTYCALATSGNYRNYRSTSEGLAAHTISAATGRTALTNTLSATIIAPTCALADALATASMAMPADSALAMIERQQHIDALIITLTDTLATPGFPEFLR